MSILELQNKVQTSMINRANFFGSDIEYLSFETNIKTVTRAYISYESFRKLEDGGNAVSNRAYFYMVDLNTIPKKRDEIISDGNRWFVEDFVITNGLYDLYCRKDTRHTNKQGRGR